VLTHFITLPLLAIYYSEVRSYLLELMYGFLEQYGNDRIKKILDGSMIHMMSGSLQESRLKEH
jgi:hypothetical protein